MLDIVYIYIFFLIYQILLSVNRNYHVFYYLLAGASDEERKAFHLLKPDEYHYLNQVRLGLSFCLPLRASNSLFIILFFPFSVKTQCSPYIHLSPLRRKHTDLHCAYILQEVLYMHL